MKYIKPLNESTPFGNHNKNTSDGMSYGQLERCIDYAKMIRERIEMGQSLNPWMYSQIAVAKNELNAVFDAIDGDDGVIERKEKPGPDAYETGLDDDEVEDKKDQMKKQAQMDDDNPESYKEMPGDEEARKSGKVKTSKHVKSYHELYGDDEANESTILEKSKVLKLKEWGIDNHVELKQLMDYLRDEDINWNQSGQSLKFDSVEDAEKAKEWLGESFLNEGVMSDLHQMAGEVKSEDEFVKRFFKKYGAKIKKSSDSVEWVKSLYQDTVDESLVNEDEKKKQSTDRTPLDDDAMETGLKKKADETGVPIGIIRAVARRGLAAWKTGHRPGATQQQWAYARVNSFLVKSEGTWGGADADLAKEVRDGGYDKKLKKA